jgi:hypothetical protein
MAIQKVCSSLLYNIGSLDCNKNNPFLDAVALIFTLDDFEFDTFADFATEAEWTDGVKAGNIFPLPGIVEVEDQSEESQYYEAPSGQRIPRRLGKYRHIYRYNLPFEVHKALQSFRSANVRVFIVDDAGNISGYSPDGTKVKGFSLSNLNPEKMTSAGQDNTPAWSPIVVDQQDAKQWNELGVFINPAWDAASLLALTDVELSVVSASATEIVIKVAYNAGLSADGSVSFVGVAGILEADFSFTTTSPTSMVDNGNGTYTFTGTSMASGSVDLVAPSSMASTGAPIKSTGPAVITIS